MKREISIDRREHSFSVLGRVDEMRRDKQFCDFIIKVGSEEIHAHRNILAGGSDYYRAMFSYDTKERKSGVVEMLGVDPECTIICIDHMYGRKVHVPDGKYKEIMHVANLMLLHALRDAIASLLEEDLDPKSFFITRKIASMYGCEKLEKKCIGFAEKYFLAISQEEEFVQLERSYIKKMIESKNVKMSEEEKLNVFLKWIKYDSDRAKILMEMLKCINMNEIPAGFRRHLIETEPLVSKNNECLLYFSLSLLDSLGVKSQNSNPSKEHDGESAIVIFDRGSPHMRLFNPRDNTFVKTQKKNDDVRVNCFSAVSIFDHIYILCEDKSVHRINYRNEASTWERLEDMMEEHGMSPPATILSNNIYVIGGYSDSYTNACERYNPVTNRWQKVKSKLHSCGGSTTASSKGFIFSFGGDDLNNGYMNVVEKFDPKLLMWTEVAPMKKAKFHMEPVAVGGKIYVLGGCAGQFLSTVECYNVKENQWTTLKPMNRARWVLRAFAINGSIFAVGGIGEQNSIERYDIAKDEWKMVKVPTDLNIAESVRVTIPQ